jgi:cellulose biosynthesis protein BcsQ
VKILASYSIKGGVGKTTTAVNLAYLAARAGHRTLLWDLDPQGAATYLFRIKPKVKGGAARVVEKRKPLVAALRGSDIDGLDLLPSDVTYRNLDLDLARVGSSASKATRTLATVLRDVRDDYDVAILDTQPGMSLVSENVVHAADLVVVPLIPTVLALRTFDQLETFLADGPARTPRLLAFFTQVDRRKTLHRETVDTLPDQRGQLSRTVVPALSVVERMSVQRAPLPVFAPRSVATRAYRDLWAEAADLVGLEPGSTRRN